MLSKELANLIKMVNHIADNIAIGQSKEITAPKVTNHLRNFWARPMKEKIIGYAISDGEKLNPVAKIAVLQLQKN
jgi:formate dehydrogenase subunit delta